MATSGLTAEQLRRIEENKRKALAKRGLRPPDHTSSDNLKLSNNVSGVNKSNEFRGVTVPGKIQEAKSDIFASKTVGQNTYQKTSFIPGIIANNNTSHKTPFMPGISATNTSQKTSFTPGISANNNTSHKTPFTTGISADNITSYKTYGVGDKLKESLTNTAITDKTSVLTKTGTNILNDDALCQPKQATSTNAFSSKSSAEYDSSAVNFNLIEQKRLQALAKRAERLNKSPLKGTNGLGPASTSGAGVVRSKYSSSSPCMIQSNAVVTNQQNDLTNIPAAITGSVRPNIQNSSKPATAAVISSHLHHSDVSINSFTNFEVGENLTSKWNDQGQSSTATFNGQDQGSTGPWNAFGGVGLNAVKGSCLLVTRDRFEVNVGYSAPLIQLFKSMETKLYDAVSKKWSFKLSEYNRFIGAVRALKSTVEIEPLPRAILQAFTSQMKGGNSTRDIPMADLSRVEQTLVNSLMSFQREGVNFGVYKNGRVLIADDMGLGKTIQAICLSCYYRDDWPLLIVVPSSVRFDWAQNFQRWVPSLDPQVINVVVTGKENCTSGLINILSYDLMTRKAEELKQKRFQIIIMDESHLLKNQKTARYKAAMPLMQNARRVILLSGTPALSRPSELYTQISAVCPFLFKFHDFGVRYCDGKQDTWGWDYSGSSNMAELQLLLEEKVMIRRLKKEVLAELPDKIRQMVLLDPGSVKINKDLKNASEVLTHKTLKKTDEHGALLEFFHKSGAAKVKAISNYVADLLEEGKKFLIFAHHAEVLNEIEKIVKLKISADYIRIDGKTSSEQRNICCKKFQHNDAIRVAILSITAANAGLNLSAASLVVFAELFWNPGILVQAEDRAHRIGQQDLVVVRYLVAKGTSDDHIWPMIQKKLDVLGKAGLTKDNFASAETTRLLDHRQELITKFLEESFSDDTGNVEAELEEFQNRSPGKGLKQPSILQYTSPMKDLPKPQCPLPRKEKPSGLFKYFSPTKKTHDKPQNDSDTTCSSPDEKSSGQMEQCLNSSHPNHSESSLSNNRMQGQIKRSLKGQGQSVSDQGQSVDELQDDLETLFKDSEDEWDVEELTPPVKKRKIQSFKPPFVK